jgi:hypothetical protein
MPFEESRNKNPREGTEASSASREPLLDDEAIALSRIACAMESEAMAGRGGFAWTGLFRPLHKRAAATGAACLDELADELSRMSLLLATAEGAEDLTACEADYLWKSRDELAQVLMEELGCAGHRSGGNSPKPIMH